MGLTVERLNNAKVADIRTLNKFRIGNIICLDNEEDTPLMFLGYKNSIDQYVLLSLKDSSIILIKNNEVGFKLIEEDSQIVY